MRATGNKVFLQREERKSAAGIITPLSKQGLAVFTVAAVGPGEWNVFTGELIPMTVKVGDKVITSKYSGTEVKADGVEYNIVRQSDILAIVE